MNDHTNEQTNDGAGNMRALATRSSQLIDAISGAIMAQAEVAAERIQLAAAVAQVEQRMAAHSAVLECIDAQRIAVEAKMVGAKGARLKLYETQLDLLAAQEVAILAKVGVPLDLARQAVKQVETKPAATHKRDGRRFVQIADGTNGVSTNGTH